MTTQKKFTCRIEELPVIAGFILSSFERDQADFESFSTAFGTDFIESFRESLDRVKMISSPATVKAEQKHITGRMNENIESMRAILLKIEGYVRRAATLTVDHNNFGISELRKEIANKNVEGILFYSRKLLELMESNNSALLEAGLTEATTSAFTSLMHSIDEDDLLHQNKMTRHTELVNINTDICNQLWNQMYEVMDTGKRLYKYEQSYKLVEYTMSSLKKRVSRKSSHQGGPGEGTGTGG